MKKFATGLAIKGTQQQLEIIQRTLEDMGYKTGTTEPKYRTGNTILVTDYADREGILGYSMYSTADVSRTLVDASNTDLVLALAAMTNDPAGMKGEWYVCTNPGFGSFKEGNLYKQGATNFEHFAAMIDDEGGPDGWGGKNHEHFRKATKEEIIAHFSVKAKAVITEFQAPFVLPNKWAIKRTPETDVEITHHMNRMFGSHNSIGNTNNPWLHNRGGVTSDRTIWSDYTEITYEQWKEYVLEPNQKTLTAITPAEEKPFVLPERWYVVVTPENMETLARWRGISLLHVGQIVGMAYEEYSKKCSKGHNRAGLIKSDGPNGYDFGQEITFEQFKTHVLKKKQIIGYNLKQGIEESPVEKALGIGNVRRNTPYNISAGSVAVNRAIRLKVLDVWFDAVYEEETVTVQGHKAKVDSLGRVKFGCQLYTKDQLEVVKNLLERTGAKHEIRVDSENITFEIVEKLLKMLK